MVYTDNGMALGNFKGVQKKTQRYNFVSLGCCFTVTSIFDQGIFEANLGRFADQIGL